MGWANSRTQTALGRKNNQDANSSWKEKQKEQRIAPLLLALYPPPGTSPTSYCMMVYVKQVAGAVVGAVVPVGTRNRSTASCTEQKLRTPVWFQVWAPAPAV